MLRYGVPMMLGWELSGIVLSLGDRYVVQALLGSGPLGNYAAAYNLCQQAEAVLSARRLIVQGAVPGGRNGIVMVRKA